MRPESPCRPATTGPALAPTPTDPVGWTACSEVDQSTFNITHWAPLPDPPSSLSICELAGWYHANSGRENGRTHLYV